MGAKKNKDLKILEHKANKNKQLAINMKKYNISDKKIAAIEEKQKFYEDWHKNVKNGHDY